MAVDNLREVAGSALLGTSIHATRHLPRGAAYNTEAGIFMHWIDVAMLTFDHEAWWAATPAENAARIVREATAAHGWTVTQEEAS